MLRRRLQLLALDVELAGYCRATICHVLLPAHGGSGTLDLFVQMGPRSGTPMLRGASEVMAQCSCTSRRLHRRCSAQRGLITKDTYMRADRAWSRISYQCRSKELVQRLRSQRAPPHLPLWQSPTSHRRNCVSVLGRRGVRSQRRHQRRPQAHIYPRTLERAPPLVVAYKPLARRQLSSEAKTLRVERRKPHGTMLDEMS